MKFEIFVRKFSRSVNNRKSKRLSGSYRFRPEGSGVVLSDFFLIYLSVMRTKKIQKKDLNQHITKLLPKMFSLIYLSTMR